LLGKHREQRPALGISQSIEGISQLLGSSHYRVGNTYRRRQVQVAVVGDTVEISVGNQLIRTHKTRHDRTREHGALANPGGRPHRINAA
jgi:hypothetical protein